MRKNSVLKLVIWALYAVAVCGGLLMTLAVTAAQQGYEGKVILIAAAVLLGAAGLIVLVLKKLFVVPGGEDDRQTIAALVLESVFFFLCLAGMLALRISAIYQVEPNEFSSLAEVSPEYRLFLTGHGGTDIFLCLLHAVFFVFGNKITAAAMLQIVLAAVAGVFFYFAVRRLSGRVAALVTFGFYAVSPYFSREMMKLVPFALFVAVCGFALWMIAGVWVPWNSRRAQRNAAAAIFYYLIVGLLLGLCCWMDTTGVMIVLIMLWTVLFCRQSGEKDGERTPSGFWNHRAFVSAFCLATGALSFLGLQWLGGFVTGKGFIAALDRWLRKFVPGMIQAPAFVSGTEAVWDLLLLMFLLVMGIFSFFRGCMRKSCGAWLAAATVLLGMQCVGIAGRMPVNSMALLFLFCAAVAGNAIGVIFMDEPAETDTAEGEEPETQPAQVSEPEIAAEPELEIIAESVTEPDPELEIVAEPVAEEPESEEIVYIENPLPLPKKSNRSAVDFDIDTPDDDDFDVP